MTNNNLNELKELKLRLKKIPFKRHDSHKTKRISTAWRRPKRRSSLARRQYKGKPLLVKVGYRTPKALRYKTLDGKNIVRVVNIDDFHNLNANKDAIIIAKVGKKRKIELLQYTLDHGFQVLNYDDVPKVIERYKEKFNKKVKENKEKSKERKEKIKKSQQKSKDVKDEIKNADVKSESKNPETMGKTETKKNHVANEKKEKSRGQITTKKKQDNSNLNLNSNSSVKDSKKITKVRTNSTKEQNQSKEKSKSNHAKTSKKVAAKIKKENNENHE